MTKGKDNKQRVINNELHKFYGKWKTYCINGMNGNITTKRALVLCSSPQVCFLQTPISFPLNPRRISPA